MILICASLLSEAKSIASTMNFGPGQWKHCTHQNHVRHFAKPGSELWVHDKVFMSESMNRMLYYAGTKKITIRVVNSEGNEVEGREIIAATRARSSHRLAREG